MEIVAFIVFFMILMVGLGIPFGYAAYARSRRHRETMAMIERGILPPGMQKRNGKGALRWGIVITFLGMALCLGLYPLGMVFGFGEFPLNFGPWMLIGLIPAFFGLSLVVVYYITRDPEPQAQVQLPQPVEQPKAPEAPVELADPALPEETPEDE
ncbi:hypothetical protein KQH61_04930 [bacterium]|nr:hypothetical protein [bacterium]MCB2179245.1 hypothetical protein [bacterium]